MSKSQAVKLAKSQLADGWPVADIKAYFGMLEDPFFANWVCHQLYCAYCDAPVQVDHKLCIDCQHELVVEQAD